MWWLAKRERHFQGQVIGWVAAWRPDRQLAQDRHFTKRQA
jgi:hypothetical protein